MQSVPNKKTGHVTSSST